jgi:hypothetical protein
MKRSLLDDKNKISRRMMLASAAPRLRRRLLPKVAGRAGASRKRRARTWTGSNSTPTIGHSTLARARNSQCEARKDRRRRERNEKLTLQTARIGTDCCKSADHGNPD